MLRIGTTLTLIFSPRKDYATGDRSLNFLCFFLFLDQCYELNCIHPPTPPPNSIYLFPFYHSFKLFYLFICSLPRLPHCIISSLRVAAPSLSHLPMHPHLRALRRHSVKNMPFDWTNHFTPLYSWHQQLYLIYIKSLIHACWINHTYMASHCNKRDAHLTH